MRSSSEKASATPARPVRKLTEEDKATMRRMPELQTRLKIKDKVEFVERWLKMSFSRYNRLENDNYTGDTAGTMTQIRLKEREILEYLALQDERVIPGSEHLIRFPHVEAVLNELRYRMGSADVSRCVGYLAPTGGGKTAICATAIKEFGGTYVEADESWKVGPFPVVRAILRAMGHFETVHSLEAGIMKMVAMMRARRDGRLLIVDETDILGPAGINILKMIPNQTPWAVLYTGLPALYDLMQRKSWFQASQLISRSAIFKVEKITPAMVMPFFSGLEFNGSAATVFGRIAEASDRFGMFRTVKLIRRIMDEETEPGEVIDLKALTRVIDIAQLTQPLSK
jgi:hypothetical protein